MSHLLKVPPSVVLFKTLWDETINPYLKVMSAMSNCSTCECYNMHALNSGLIENMLATIPYRELLKLHPDGKNNTKAAEIRKQGNEMFYARVKRYIEALKLYNESILYAEKGSEERALAYGNRSTICLKLHRYEDCLKNIRLAQESNYPKRLAHKLKEREQIAKRALKNASKNRNANKGTASHANEQAERQLHCKLTYTAHENMPQVANCIQLRNNRQYGRHLLTNRPLNVGDVVMIDKPFVTVLYDTLRYLRCAYCYHETIFTLIPCEGCTMAMYCSEECLTKAHQQYHRYECAVIRDIWHTCRDGPVIALRTIALAIAAFDHDLEALKEHLEGLDESRINAFTMDWNTATPKDIYNTVHMLETLEQRRSAKDMAFKIFVATIVHQLVMERTELGSICEVDVNKKKLLFDLILRYVQIFDCNKQGVSFMEYTVDAGTNEIMLYATGCFPLLSMLNHSCAPNTKCITLRDGRIALHVTRPIPDGGQLFEDYGIRHLTDELEERQDCLKAKYRFRCRCEACQHDYPAIPELLIEGIINKNIKTVLTVDQETKLHDTKKVMKYISTLKAYVQKNQKNYPNYQVCYKQSQLELCYFILYSYTSKLPKYWKYCNP